MQLIKVISSNITHIGYSIDKKILRIVFNSGGTYTYTNISKEIYKELLSSKSVGKYFHQHIKGKYEYKKQ